MSYVKVYKYKKQISLDNGVTWQDVTPAEYVPSGDPIGYYDTLEECMAQYRTIQSGTTCVGYDKHNQDVYEVSYDNGVTWEVVSTSAGTLIEANSEDCGYIPPTPCECSAFTFDTTSHTITDTAQSVTFNYSGCTKPDLSSASTYGWMLIANHEYNAETTVGYITANVSANTSSARTGILYTSLSGSTCQNLVISQQAPIQYRWTQSGTTCIGYDKYQNNIKEQSTDGGVTWTVVTPPEYSASTLIEADSPDCGYVPPQTKYKLTLNDSSTVSAECDSTSSITQAEISAYTSTTVSAEIGDCVTSIGSYAFYKHSGLTSIDIPNSVTGIDNMAFSDCASLTSIDIPDSVTYLQSFAFNNCSGLTNIDIPNSVASIGVGAFLRCSSLTSLTIGSGVTTFGNSAFGYCVSLTSVTIPNSVISIGEGSFHNCSSLTSIDIPNSVTSISGGAFQNCSSLTSIDIPNSVTSIGYYAFQHCSGLTSVTVNAVTPPTLGGNAFYNTNNCPIYVPCQSVNAYKAASGWTEYESRIQGIAPCEYVLKYKLTLNNSNIISAECDSTSAITSGEVSSQYSGTVVSAEIGDCVTNLGNYVFRNCSGLTSVNIPSGVNIIGEYAFYNCIGLTSMDIPSGVTTINTYTFAECSGLTSVNIPSGVTNIYDFAFAGCSSLSSVTIPSGITNLYYGVFVDCSGLSSITILATQPPTLYSYRDFYDNYVYPLDNTNNCPIYVPSGSVEAYKIGYWRRYASRIQAIP